MSDGIYRDAGRRGSDDFATESELRAFRLGQLHGHVDPHNLEPIVKRYTPEEYADLQRIAKLYLSVCDFGNMDVERRRTLCRRIVSDG